MRGYLFLVRWISRQACDSWILYRKLSTVTTYLIDNIIDVNRISTLHCVHKYAKTMGRSTSFLKRSRAGVDTKNDGKIEK